MRLGGRIAADGSDTLFYTQIGGASFSSLTPVSVLFWMKGDAVHGHGSRSGPLAARASAFRAFDVLLCLVPTRTMVCKGRRLQRFGRPKPVSYSQEPRRHPGSRSTGRVRDGAPLAVELVGQLDDEHEL